MNHTSQTTLSLARKINNDTVVLYCAQGAVIVALLSSLLSGWHTYSEYLSVFQIVNNDQIKLAEYLLDPESTPQRKLHRMSQIEKKVYDSKNQEMIAETRFLKQEMTYQVDVQYSDAGEKKNVLLNFVPQIENNIVKWHCHHSGILSIPAIVHQKCPNLAPQESI